MKPWQHCLRCVLVPALALMLTAVSARAQSDLEKTLQTYAADAVTGYIQPIADLFGANMNAGFYHSAAIPRMGLHISFSIVGMAASVGDDQKTYSAKTPPGFNPASFKTSTVFGPKENSTVTDANTGLTYSGSGGVINTSMFPLAVPQLTIGSFYGTQATIRFIPIPSLGDGKIPKSTLFAIGARHSISQYLPSIPLDMAVGVFYNRFSFGDLIDFKGVSIGAEASKSFSVLHVYGGFAYEKSTMNLSYTPTTAGIPPVSIDLEGANKFRATIGLGLGLGFFNIFADANFGSVTCFSGGIGFGSY